MAGIFSGDIMAKNQHIGSSLDDFLADEGVLAEAQAEAIKRVISWHVSQYLESTGETKKAFAARLHTSRTQIDRLLDERNTSLNLKTIVMAIEAIGKKIEFNIA